MPTVKSNGIELFYDERGEGPPVVLAMGLGAQMTLWRDEFCDQLADLGHRVIRFDNRDIGLSSKMADHGVPNVRKLFLRAYARRPVDVPYRLEDMSDDLVGLLDALDIERAHLVGASMGGMIVQLTAIRHPERVRSMTSIMSTTGRRRHTWADPRALRYLLSRPASKKREDIIEFGVDTFRAISGSGFEFDADALRDLMSSNYDRSFYPPGYPRQFMAVLTATDRVPGLRRLTMPSLVVHGTEDPLVLPIGGKATARAIPGARLHMVKGMGHALPRGAWPELTREIGSHLAGAR